MKKKIIFLTDNLFSNRDYDRYGIKFLKNFFAINIINVSKITNISSFKTIKKNNKKFKEYKIVKSLDELKKIIKKKNYNYAYDYMGITLNAWLIRNFIKNNNIKIIKNFADDPSIPVKQTKNIFRRIYNNFFSRKQLGGSILRKFINRTIIRYNKKFIWDYGVFFNDKAFNKSNKKKCINVIKSHTFDYDTYLQINKKKKILFQKNYFVFIDNNLPGHPDYKYHGTKPPVIKKKYLSELTYFFDKFEQITKSKILIASNPKTIYKNKKTFGNRKIFNNKTSLLVKFSKGVIMHNSTAINFPILFKKPVLFLTSDHINESWLSEGIYLLAKSLNLSVINIDNFSKKNLINKQYKVRDYDSFLNAYIKSSNTKKNFSWKILTDNLK